MASESIIETNYFGKLNSKEYAVIKVVDNKNTSSSSTTKVPRSPVILSFLLPISVLFTIISGIDFQPATQYERFFPATVTPGVDSDGRESPNVEEEFN